MAKSDPSDTRGVKNKTGKKYGNKTIEVNVRFWTDRIAEKGKIIQRNAWDSGTVSMKKNKLHGIKASRSKPFNSILDLQSVLADLLGEQGIVLHPNQKLRKILKS